MPTERKEKQHSGAETAPEHTARASADRTERAERTERTDRTGSDADRINIEGMFEQIDDYGFIRNNPYAPSNDDVFVGADKMRMFGLKTGDVVKGVAGRKGDSKSRPLIFVSEINSHPPYEMRRRSTFESRTPVFPTIRFNLSNHSKSASLYMIDSLSPIGKGQRALIASMPKCGKTTILKEIANGIIQNSPSTYLFVVLIDERPEEVTDFCDSVSGPRVEIVASTFDESPEHHERAAEITLERAKRLVECNEDVVILVDSITRLTRAYNLTVESSGKTLSGGLDPASLFPAKRLFGAARNLREGGSLTIIATALIETGSRMDDMIYEEFKGTGNMELVLSRKLQERNIFPAIDITRSGTRRCDLLQTRMELETANAIRQRIDTAHMEETTKSVLDEVKRMLGRQDFRRRTAQKTEE